MSQIHEIIICKTRIQLNRAIKVLNDVNQRSIGFVPTMGALHEGHQALVRRADKENDIVVVSIFVNPTQFNNSEDLKKYPITIESDIDLLKQTSSCLVFIPDFQEIYPEAESYAPIDLGGLDKVMEGKFRPGHFQGVVHVVHNLFNIVKPTRAYLGKKDFQQLAIVNYMNKHFNFPIEIIGCETVREKNGLAQSSRNLRLSQEQKEDAHILFQTLCFIKENKVYFASPKELKNEAIKKFNSGNLKLEYLEIVDAKSFEILSQSWSDYPVACIAAYCGDIRLIDNLEL